MGHDPYISRDLHTAVEGDGPVPRIWAGSTSGEPRAVIEAIERLNTAVHLARGAGWSVQVTAHEQSPNEGQTGPFRTVRATITREV